MGRSPITKGDDIMATQRKNFQIALEKAKISEDLVCTLLAGEGYQVYRPTVPGRAPIDILATPMRNIDDDVSPSSCSFWIDVKCQPARSAYGDQGVNEANLKEYLKWEDTTRIPVLIFFVDENDGTIKITKRSLKNNQKPTTYNDIHYPWHQPKYNDPNSIVVYIDPRRLHLWRTIHPDTLLKLRELRTTDFIGG